MAGSWSGCAAVFEGEVKVYPLTASPDIRTLTPAYAPISLEPGALRPLDFSPDSRMFAIADDLMNVRLYETATGRELAVFSAPEPASIVGHGTLKFTRDGQWLALARNDGKTIAWNLPILRTEIAKLGLDWKDARPAVDVGATETGGPVGRPRASGEPAQSIGEAEAESLRLPALRDRVAAQ